MTRAFLRIFKRNFRALPPKHSVKFNLAMQILARFSKRNANSHKTCACKKISKMRKKHLKSNCKQSGLVKRARNYSNSSALAKQNSKSKYLRSNFKRIHSVMRDVKRESTHDLNIFQNKTKKDLRVLTHKDNSLAAVKE